MHTRTTTAMIEALVLADSQDQRRQHVLRQALLGLVRQAQAEHMLEMRRSAARLAGLGEAGWRRRAGPCQEELPQSSLLADPQDKSA